MTAFSLLRPDWHARTACGGNDPDQPRRARQHFAAPGTESAHRARARCHFECPVRTECVTWALDQIFETGIWGGLDPAEIRAERVWRGLNNPTPKDLTTTALEARHPDALAAARNVDHTPKRPNSRGLDTRVLNLVRTAGGLIDAIPGATVADQLGAQLGANPKALIRVLIRLHKQGHLIVTRTRPSPRAPIKSVHIPQSLLETAA